MDNPLRAIRERLGLTRREMAAAARLRYDELTRAEAGMLVRPPARLLALLAELGEDPDAVADAYRRYREELRRLALARLAHLPDAAARPDRAARQGGAPSDGSPVAVIASDHGTGTVPTTGDARGPGARSLNTAERAGLSADRRDAQSNRRATC